MSAVADMLPGWRGPLARRIESPRSRRSPWAYQARSNRSSIQQRKQARRGFLGGAGIGVAVAFLLVAVN